LGSVAAAQDFNLVGAPRFGLGKGLKANGNAAQMFSTLDNYIFPQFDSVAHSSHSGRVPNSANDMQ
jgi:hypothetical protein